MFTHMFDHKAYVVIFVLTSVLAYHAGKVCKDYCFVEEVRKNEPKDSELLQYMNEKYTQIFPWYIRNISSIFHFLLIIFGFCTLYYLGTDEILYFILPFVCVSMMPRQGESESKKEFAVLKKKFNVTTQEQGKADIGDLQDAMSAKLAEKMIAAYRKKVPKKEITETQNIKE